MTSYISDNEFDLLFSRFEENRYNALIELSKTELWNYLDTDNRTKIYDDIVKDWEEAKIFCLFPDIYNVNNRLTNKLNDLSVNVLKIIIKNFDGDYKNCNDKIDYINILLELLPNFIPSITV